MANPLIGSICLSMFTCKTHVQMKPASCFRLAPCFCLSRLRAGRRRRQRLAACENLRHIYNILILGAQKFAMRQMRAWKIAQSQICLNYYTIFIFCARTFKTDAMFLNFARLRAAQKKLRNRDLGCAIQTFQSGLYCTVVFGL